MDAKKNIEQSLDKLRELATQREEIEAQMGKLHLAVRALCNLIDDKPEREAYKAVLDRYRVRIGLNDLVRLCLNTLDAALTPSEIRNFIVNYGSEHSTQQNLLQSVHTVLKRLEEAGEVKQGTNQDGEKVFKRVTIGEKLVRIGTEEKTANRVGKRVENRFPSMLSPELAERIGMIAAENEAIKHVATDLFREQRKQIEEIQKRVNKDFPFLGKV